MKSDAIFIEGRDGVGKNTAALSTISCLLQNRRPVLLTNFPQYWYLGTFIRKMNRGFADSVLLKMTPRRQALVRCMAFAMDRVTAIPFIEGIFDREPETVLVSDRGPDSNIITLSYLLAKGKISFDDVVSIIDNEYKTLEVELRDLVNVKPVQCKTTPELKDLISDRKQLDDYEASDVQVVIDSVYKLINPQTIITNNDGKWRSYDEIATDSLKNSLLCSNTRDYDLKGAFNREELSILGPNMLAEYMPKTYRSKANLARIDKWIDLSLAFEHVENGMNKKELLDTLEAEISKDNNDLLFESERFLERCEGSKVFAKGMARIVKDYPELIDIVRVVGFDRFAEYLQKY